MVGIMTGRAFGSKATFVGLGVEVQGNVQLAGQQVAGAGLGTQAVFDEGADQPYASGFVIGVMIERLEHFDVGLAQALRVDHDADIDRKGAFFLVEIQIDRHHLADFDAEEFHRRIDLEPAQGLIEAHGQVLRLAVWRGEGGLLVVEQFVGLYSAAAGLSLGL